MANIQSLKILVCPVNSVVRGDLSSAVLRRNAISYRRMKQFLATNCWSLYGNEVKKNGAGNMIDSQRAVFFFGHNLERPYLYAQI